MSWLDQCVETVQSSDSPKDIAGAFYDLSTVVYGHRESIQPASNAYPFTRGDIGVKTYPSDLGERDPVTTAGFYRGDDGVGLVINYRWWENSTREEQLACLLHELTHTKVTGHDIDFWIEFAENFSTIAETPESLPTNYTDVSLQRVSEYIRDNAQPEVVSNECESECSTIQNRMDSLMRV